MCGGMIEKRLILHLRSLVSPPPETDLTHASKTETNQTEPTNKQYEEGKARPSPSRRNPTSRSWAGAVMIGEVLPPLLLNPS